MIFQAGLVILSYACQVSPSGQPVASSLYRQPAAAFAVAFCPQGYPDPVAGTHRLDRFGPIAPGHAAIHSRQDWLRFLARYWMAESSTRFPVEEPPWDSVSVIALAQTVSGCDANPVTAATLSGRTLQLTINADTMGPCMMSHAGVWLLWVMRPHVVVAIDDRSELGPIGLDRRLPF